MVEPDLLAEQTSASPMLYDAVYVPINAEEFELAERICDETLDDARARGSAARHRHHIVFLLPPGRPPRLDPRRQNRRMGRA
jgi:hypothetical protein